MDIEKRAAFITYRCRTSRNIRGNPLADRLAVCDDGGIAGEVLKLVCTQAYDT
jgi:hypothetical protein